MPIDASLRAERIWVKIERKPSSVAFTRPKQVLKTGTIAALELPVQVVRVVSDNRASDVVGVAGTAPRRQAIVYGIRDHATLPDTDMDEGYTFLLDGDLYRIVDTIKIPGGLQGIAVVDG